jgi:hypothetical protein
MTRPTQSNWRVWGSLRKQSVIGTGQRIGRRSFLLPGRCTSSSAFFSALYLPPMLTRRSKQTAALPEYRPLSLRTVRPEINHDPEDERKSRQCSKPNLFPCDSARFEPVSHALACREHSRQAGESELRNAFFLQVSNHELASVLAKQSRFSEKCKALPREVNATDASNGVVREPRHGVP